MLSPGRQVATRVPTQPQIQHASLRRLLRVRRSPARKTLSRQAKQRQDRPTNRTPKTWTTGLYTPAIRLHAAGHVVRVNVTSTAERRFDPSINDRGTASEFEGLAVRNKSVIEFRQQLKAVGLLLVVIDEHCGIVGLDDLPDLVHRFDGCSLIGIERRNPALGEILLEMNYIA